MITLHDVNPIDLFVDFKLQRNNKIDRKKQAIEKHQTLRIYARQVEKESESAIVETRHAEEWEHMELNASVKCQKW